MFGAGDVATSRPYPRPKAGVFAVRQVRRGGGRTRWLNGGGNVQGGYAAACAPGLCPWARSWLHCQPSAETAFAACVLCAPHQLVLTGTLTYKRGSLCTHAQGPPLTNNLRRLLSNQPLEPFEPQVGGGWRVGSACRQAQVHAWSQLPPWRRECRHCSNQRELALATTDLWICSPQPSSHLPCFAVHLPVPHHHRGPLLRGHQGLDWHAGGPQASEAACAMSLPLMVLMLLLLLCLLLSTSCMELELHISCMWM